ncbi:hypothetical protein KKH23_02950 [Patescibacteria group bacterium]|nr:hypothetical protein [Patescibacteria group bacterium]MBU0846124.1 hypothetical protein [Patescibacteria group bacterium]MBU0922787.1 hypothetical protein [Patescibacteria group bacterium]MBU1066304.1 hypothetical protein [Patescibacteria group bacterium]
MNLLIKPLNNLRIGLFEVKKEFAAKEKLEIVQSESVASAGGRKGGFGGIPPALQILGEICSNFFKRTPPIHPRLP